MSAECETEIEFEEATQLAQIISGVAFIGLSMWLIFGNTQKIAVAHKATLEQRLAAASTINTAVCLFSGFFNLLQLTKIDDFALPRPTQFTLDLSRPIEWIVTCPIMQMSLVLLGGSRIPAYRRYMMPLLSVAVLLCGTASMFSEGPIRFAWYGFGFILAMIMFYHNILQIGENSDGTETISSGPSDFRRLSILLIATWFPFPLWFLLSPEGFGVITDTTAIHMGWVVLNIISKFSFIIYLQQVKGKYCGKVDATRELYDLNQVDKFVSPMPTEAGAEMNGEMNGQAWTSPTKRRPALEKQMKRLVEETMAQLSMREHSDRFMQVLDSSGVDTLPKLEALNEEQCMDLQVPWNLVSAVQKRWVTERLEKADLALELPSYPGTTHAPAEVDQDMLQHLFQHQKASASAQEAASAMCSMRIAQMEEKLASMLFRLEEKMEKQTDAVQESGSVLQRALTSTQESQTAMLQLSLSAVQESQASLQRATTSGQETQAASFRRLEEKIGDSSIKAQFEINELALTLGRRVDESRELQTSSVQALDGKLDTVREVHAEVLRLAESSREAQAEVTKQREAVIQSQNMHAQEAEARMEQKVVDKLDQKLGLHQEALLRHHEAQQKLVVDSVAEGFTRGRDAAAQEVKELASNVERSTQDLASAVERSAQELQSKVERATQEMGSKVASVADGFQRMEMHSENHASRLEQKFAAAQAEQAQHATHLQKMERAVDSVATSRALSPQEAEEADKRLARRLDDMGRQVSEHCDREVKAMSSVMRNELASIVQQSGVITGTVQKSVAAQDEFMGDIRRMNMMLMDMMTGLQIRSQETAETVGRGLSHLTPLTPPPPAFPSAVEVKNDVAGDPSHHSSIQDGVPVSNAFPELQQDDGK